MALKMAIYKCMKCGNVVEVLVQGTASMICCGEEMKLMDEKSKEGAGEKHLPTMEKTATGTVVRVGTVPHPMDADHWIQFIEVLSKDGLVLRRDLNPGDKPERSFGIPLENVAAVREFCNKHGLWSK